MASQQVVIRSNVVSHSNSRRERRSHVYVLATNVPFEIHEHFGFKGNASVSSEINVFIHLKEGGGHFTICRRLKRTSQVAQGAG